MRYLKFSLICSLVWSLIFSSQIFANIHTFEKEKLLEIVNSYNATVSNLKSVIAVYEKTDPNQAAELKTFIAKEKIDDNLELPKIFLEKDVIILKVFNEKFTINTISENLLKLTFRDKVINLKKEVTIDQIREAIYQAIKVDGIFSYLNLIIPEAHAELATLILVIGLAVLALVVIKDVVSSLSENWTAIKLISKTKELCSKQLEKNTMTSKEADEIKQMIKKLQKLITRCNLNYKFPNEEACKKIIPETISCLESITSVQNSVNQSARESVKKVDSHKELTNKEKSINATHGK